MKRKHVMISKRPYNHALLVVLTSQAILSADLIVRRVFQVESMFLSRQAVHVSCYHEDLKIVNEDSLPISLGGNSLK